MRAMWPAPAFRYPPAGARFALRFPDGWAISTRPMRGMLLRASNVYHRPPKYTSNLAARSIYSVRWRHSNIAQTASAVPGGNIHASAEGDGDVGVIAADARALVECLPSCSRGARLLIIEGDVIMHKNADRLHPRPTRSCVPEQLPRGYRKEVRLAIAAAQREHERFFRQILNGVLRCIGNHNVRNS